MLTAFLADSGVRTRGLAWTTGAKLPVKWATPKPVASEQWQRNEGFSLVRTGKVRSDLGNGSTSELELQLLGTDLGLQRVTVILNYPPEDEKPDPLGSLQADGITLTPLKCDPKTEGATYGNLVFVAKAPGKTASGLHENWNCGHDQCQWVLSILYRKADVTKVECSGG
jgi:hypothetical protein